MPKYSDIVQQTIARSIQISKDMRKAYEKELKVRAKEAKQQLKIPSVVQEFEKEHKKELTPAEKGKRTKAKKKRLAIQAADLAAKKEAGKAFIIKKTARTKHLKEALASGRSPSDL